jgi:malonyl-CoA decarboxylase
VTGRNRTDVPSLVDRRAELLSRRDTVQDPDGQNPRLAELTNTLDQLLSSGHRVRCLEPDASPHDAALAERLVHAEPVNPTGSRAERERRFADDRRVIVIEHRALPGRPINVLWVALCCGLPPTLGGIVDPQTPVLDPLTADTAVFYSIWNAEAGLSGLGRGRELIGGAAELLRREFHQLETLTTMSPVPGFRRWAESHPSDMDLMAHCARYLTAKGADQRLLDPVARFHMGNGARLWRLIPGADESSLGRERSFAIMANYRYFPEDLGANRSSLTERSPALGQEVEALLDR